MCHLSPVFLHIFFENVIPELCNCYNWDLFKNSKNSKFFSIFVTCHHLHYLVWYESKKLWWLDNAKMLSIFSNRVDINFFWIYKFRLVSNHKKNISTLCEIWNQKNDGQGSYVWLWIEERNGWSKFSYQNYFTATVQIMHNVLIL